MLCRDFREIADSYLSDELLIETNHDVISHLENCAECRREMSARRELRDRLRSAFVSAPDWQMEAEFGDRLRTQLRENASAQSHPRMTSWGEPWLVKQRRAFVLSLAACLVVVAGFGLILVRQQITQRSRRLAATAQDQQRTIQIGNNNSQRVNSPEIEPGLPIDIARMELVKFAVGNHRNCAIEFRLPTKPISLEEAGRKYDPVYLNLAQAGLAGQNGLPPEAELVEAHSCVFEGRRFAHLVFKSHGRIVSLLVTDVQRNGTNEASSRPNGARSDQVIACSQLDGYQVSCFATAQHAVFVISDLPEGENLALARALAPAVFAHLSQTERVS